MTEPAHRPGKHRLRHAARRDQGAATIETAGMTVGVAVVVAAVVAVLVATSPVLSDHVSRAFCLVFSLGQGDCGGRTSPEAHRPTKPCVVASNGHKASVEASAVISVGAGDQWQVDHLSDGNYRVTRGLNAMVGAGGGFGYSVTATVNDNRYGAAANAAGDIRTRIGMGQVFYVPDDEAVKHLLAAHQRDVVKSATVGPAGPRRWLVDRAESALGVDDPLPPPESTWYEGTLEIDGDASVTFAVMSASASAAASSALGYREHADGSTTQYVRAVVRGSTQATALGSNAEETGYELWKAKAEGGAQVVVEIERGSDGTITAVRSRAVLDGEALASTRAHQDGVEPQANSYVERTLELPVRTAADADIARRYLRALGMAEVAGFTLPPSPVVHAASGTDAVLAPLAYVKAARDRGYVTEQSFTHDTSSSGFTMDAKYIAKIGGDISHSTNERASTGGRYWDGTTMVPWTGCAPA